MDFKQIFEWLKGKPVWVKALSILVITLVSAVLLFSSCSSTRAIVRNPRNSATTNITVSVSNPQNVDVKPSADSASVGIQLTPKIK